MSYAHWIGRRFERLVVIGIGPRKNRTQRLIVRCDCGAEKTVQSGVLTRGNTRSCGCLRREVHTKHGGSIGTPLYFTWHGLIARCFYPKHASYARYGGKGITCPERWKSFSVFKSEIIATIGDRPEGHTLDRIENNKSYALENIRWATPRQQSANSRTPLRVEIGGEIYSLPDLARKHGLTLGAINHRWNRGDRDLARLLRPASRGRPQNVLRRIAAKVNHE
jgi:hypothetical protein